MSFEQPNPVAVICTALADEYNMVRDHLNAPLSEWEERGSLYELGIIRGVSGDWTVALVETGAGNTTAGIELERAVSVFAPDVVLFVGVAGGRKDVALGDVVAADAVYDFESGKDIENCYLPRIKTQPSSHRLVQRAKAVARRGRWQQRIQPACPVSPPNAVVKPLAAGSKVVAHRRSQTAQHLETYCGDAVAVDMEGYGFLHGAYVNDTVEALVIRGISDRLTNKTESADRQWQPAAARHAAAFAVELLTTLTPGTPPAESDHTSERVASITATHTGAVRQSGSGHPITNTGIVLGDINVDRAVQ